MSSNPSRYKLPLIAVALILLLSFPILSIANVPRLFGGIPVLFVYVFVVWLLAIFFLWMGNRSKQEGA